MAIAAFVTPNQAPAVEDDAYPAAKKITSVPADRGVLANDSDADEDALTASLVSGPSKGKLTLNPDGSFEYEGKVRKKRPVTFVYEASDGKGGVNQGTVTISR